MQQQLKEQLAALQKEKDAANKALDGMQKERDLARAELGKMRNQSAQVYLTHKTPPPVGPYSSPTPRVLR